MRSSSRRSVQQGAPRGHAAPGRLAPCPRSRGAAERAGAPSPGIDEAQPQRGARPSPGRNGRPHFHSARRLRPRARVERWKRRRGTLHVSHIGTRSARRSPASPTRSRGRPPRIFSLLEAFLLCLERLPSNRRQRFEKWPVENPLEVERRRVVAAVGATLHRRRHERRAALPRAAADVARAALEACRFQSRLRARASLKMRRACAIASTPACLRQRPLGGLANGARGGR